MEQLGDLQQSVHGWARKRSYVAVLDRLAPDVAAYVKGQIPPIHSVDGTEVGARRAENVEVSFPVPDSWEQGQKVPVDLSNDEIQYVNVPPGAKPGEMLVATLTLGSTEPVTAATVGRAGWSKTSKQMLPPPKSAPTVRHGEGNVSGLMDKLEKGSLSGRY